MTKSAHIFFAFVLIFSVWLPRYGFAQTIDSTKKTESYTVTDVNPVPPGGSSDTFNKRLAKEIEYPKRAIDANAMGTVYVTLIIEKDGEVSNIAVKKDEVGYGCAEEAMRAIKALGAWQPGRINGEPVRVRYTIPVKFNLTDDPPFWSKWFKKKTKKGAK